MGIAAKVYSFHSLGVYLFFEFLNTHTTDPGSSSWDYSEEGPI